MGERADRYGKTGEWISQALRQTEEASVILLTWSSKTAQTRLTRGDSDQKRSPLWGGAAGLTTMGHKGAFWVTEMLCLWMGVVITRVYKSSHQAECFTARD